MKIKFIFTIIFLSLIFSSCCFIGSAPTNIDVSNSKQQSRAVSQRNRVLYFSSKANFPNIGEPQKRYKAADTQLLYHWDSNFNKYLIVSSPATTLVSSPEDFPAPENGEINLETGQFYLLTQNVIIDDPLVIGDGGSVRIGAIKGDISLTSNTTDFMFKGTSLGVLELTDISLLVPNGVYFDIASPYPGAYIKVEEVFFLGAESLGNVSDVAYFNLSALYLDIGDGFNFTNNSTLTLQNLTCENWRNSGGTFFVVDGTSTIIEWRGGTFIPQSTEYIWDIKQSANFQTGVINNNTVPKESKDRVFVPGSQDQIAVELKFTGNAGIPDSTTRADLSISENALTTTIATQNTPTQINALWSDGTTIQRMRMEDICTFDNTANEVETTFNHGLSDDDDVYFYLTTGTLPAELSAGTAYYVSTTSVTTFQLSLTEGGSIIDFTDDGTAPTYYQHTKGNTESGLLAYIGVEDINIDVGGWIFIEGTTGAKTDIQCHLMKVGTDRTETLFRNGSILGVTNSLFGSIQIESIIKLETEEGLKIYISNRTSAGDVNVVNAEVTFKEA